MFACVPLFFALIFVLKNIFLFVMVYFWRHSDISDIKLETINLRSHGMNQLTCSRLIQMQNKHTLRPSRLHEQDVGSLWEAWIVALPSIGKSTIYIKVHP